MAFQLLQRNSIALLHFLPDSARGRLHRHLHMTTGMAAIDARCYPRAMAPPTRPRATYDDLLAVPEHLVAEIVDGELYTSPRPAPRHAKASSALVGILHAPFNAGRGGPGGWTILFEPELHLSDDVLVPDIAGWRRERLPSLPETAWFSLAPDWICEILSPSTAALDRVKKLGIYARESVAHAWLVDPIARTLEILRLEGSHWTIVGTHAGAEIVRGEPFTDGEIDLAALWAPDA
jgi:Uma2 family endonuclease